MRALAATVLLAACAGEERLPGPAAPAVQPAPRPASCARISPGPLQPALDAAADGSSVCLSPGAYPGPVRVDRGLTVWGPRDAVIRTSGQGTTVRLEGRGTRLLGLTVDGSGGRYDTLDAAVHVQGQDLSVEGVAIRNATFGILVEQSKGALVRGNEVAGQRDRPFGLRGDAIRVWETQASRVEGNLVTDGRDVVVWYSDDNVLEGNVISGGRYGTHLMYTHRNVVRGNRYLGDVVGVFLMYSRDILVDGNLVANAAGSAGIGLGLKESGNVRATGNHFLHDTTGAYLDTSPLQLDEHNVFEGNEFRLGKAGVVFHSSEQRNSFRNNVFRDNAQQVRVDGGGDALGVEWLGNSWDDYEGYDLDGDGIGDVPYELRSLSADLISLFSDLEFLQGTPALDLVNAISEIMPLLAPSVVLRDPRPRTGREPG